jgi:hypothetical protein
MRRSLQAGVAVGSWPDKIGVDMDLISLATPDQCPSVAAVSKVTTSGVELFKWDVLVARAVHPIQVAVIEAMQWIDRPLATSELSKLFDNAYSVSHLGYHVTALAKMEAIRATHCERVRGTIKQYYVLAI